MHDVAARRAVERAYARLAAVVESSEDGVIAATLEGTVVSWNRSAERLYGYSASEIIGQHTCVLSSSDDKRLVSHVIALLQQGQTVEPVETSRVRRDGTRWAASLAFSPIKDGDGQMIGLSCITRDITEQQRVKAALVESESRLRRLSDAAFEGICVSRNGILLDVNAAYMEMLGFDSAEELIGQDAFQLIVPETRMLVRQRVMEGSKAPYEAMMVRRDGTTFPAEVRVRYLSLGANQPVWPSCAT